MAKLKKILKKEGKIYQSLLRQHRIAVTPANILAARKAFHEGIEESLVRKSNPYQKRTGVWFPPKGTPLAKEYMAMMRGLKGKGKETRIKIRLDWFKKHKIAPRAKKNPGALMLLANPKKHYTAGDFVITHTDIGGNEFGYCRKCTADMQRFKSDNILQHYHSHRYYRDSKLGKQIVEITAQYNPRKTVSKYEGRPPKEWFYYVVKQLQKDRTVTDPHALAGWIWYHHMKPKAKRMILKTIKRGRLTGHAKTITAAYLRKRGKLAANLPSIPGMPKKVTPGLKQALTLYHKRHGVYPESISKVNVPAGYPKYGVAMGSTPEVLYKAPGHSPIKKGYLYKHKFDNPTVLVTDPEGKGLFVVNPRMKAKRWITG